MRSSSSRSGNRRFRCLGPSVDGTHCVRDFVQLIQGNLRSHRILRCWQSTHASTRFGFGCWEEDDSGEMVDVDMAKVLIARR